MQIIFDLAKRIEGLDTAIILVAKREKAQWTYKNIIQSVLLPMIINNQHPCIYSAFSLLGKLIFLILYYIYDEGILMYPALYYVLTGRLLRAFPLQDKDQIVHDISEQLCVLIQSGQGSTFILCVWKTNFQHTNSIYFYTLYIYNLINF